jgi:hypothetical protein
MKVQFTPVTGRIISVGNSTSNHQKSGAPSGVWTYSFITLKDEETGQEIVVNDCKVVGALNEHVDPGEHGTFLFGKAFGQRELLAYKNDQRQTFNPHIGDLPSLKIFFIAAYFIAIMALPFLIGIPLLIAVVWLHKNYKKLPGILEKGMTDHGFDMSRNIKI